MSIHISISESSYPDPPGGSSSPPSPNVAPSHHPNLSSTSSIPCPPGICVYSPCILSSNVSPNVSPNVAPPPTPGISNSSSGLGTSSASVGSASSYDRMLSGSRSSSIYMLSPFPSICAPRSCGCPPPSQPILA